MSQSCRKFIFIGDSGWNPPHMWMCGYNFELHGAAVEVNLYAADSLAKNRQFKEV